MTSVLEFMREARKTCKQLKIGKARPFKADIQLDKSTDTESTTGVCWARREEITEKVLHVELP